MMEDIKTVIKVKSSQFLLSFHYFHKQITHRGDPVYR